MTKVVFFLMFTTIFTWGTDLYAQTELEEVQETLEAYIKDNHIQKVENMVHKFCSSKVFLETLLGEGHNIDPSTFKAQRKEVGVGKDIDVFVKHFSEHQNFTMIMVPINFYSLGIYDTLLFSVLEVSDDWLKRKFPYDDIKKKDVKDELLSLENHAFLRDHMYQQAIQNVKTDASEVKVTLNETYISSSTIHLHTGALSREEKRSFKKSWGLIKKIFSHNVELNIELNVYVFGHDDMEVIVNSSKGKATFTVTPANVFRRHHFLESGD